MVTRFLLLPLLVSSVSFLITIFPSRITCLLSLVYVLPHPWSSSHRPMPCSWLQIYVLLSSSNAVKSPSTCRRYFCSCCYSSSKVLQSWPYSPHPSTCSKYRNASNTKLFPLHKLLQSSPRYLRDELPPTLRVAYHFDLSSSPSSFSIVMLWSWTACGPSS